MTTDKEHTQQPSWKENKRKFVPYLYPVCIPSSVTLFFRQQYTQTCLNIK